MAHWMKLLNTHVGAGASHVRFEPEQSIPMHVLIEGKVTLPSADVRPAGDMTRTSLPLPAPVSMPTAEPQAMEPPIPSPPSPEQRHGDDDVEIRAGKRKSNRGRPKLSPETAAARVLERSEAARQRRLLQKKKDAGELTQNHVSLPTEVEPSAQALAQPQPQLDDDQQRLVDDDGDASKHITDLPRSPVIRIPISPKVRPVFLTTLGSLHEDEDVEPAVRHHRAKQAKRVSMMLIEMPDLDAVALEECNVPMSTSEPAAKHKPKTMEQPIQAPVRETRSKIKPDETTKKIKGKATKKRELETEGPVTKTPKHDDIVLVVSAVPSPKTHLASPKPRTKKRF